MTREPLSRERICEAAVAVADAGGLSALSMRSVGRELGVEAMSLYHHVGGKEELLDDLVDWTFAQIELPRPTDGWRQGMARRAESARRILTAHPWSLTLIDSRSNPGPALLRHHDAVIGCLRRGGFTVALAARAFSVIDAYVYGFALTERNLPFEADTGAGEYAERVMEALGGYPHLLELVRHLTGGGDYSFAAEFDLGLELILDGLERRLERRLEPSAEQSLEQSCEPSAEAGRDGSRR
ncbi:MAG: TetR family transcriptional regulator [Candidatus Leucobacter sulfamidivorax]|nr:TetR family transcriptional regulator [Candidatus Leucobacter sulfamidivorax]